MTVATPTLKISWLGQVALCQDGVRVQPAKPSRKADVLLAYLALNAGLTHERSKLIDAFCFNVKDPAGDFRGILKRAREMVGPGGQDCTEQFYTIPKANGDSAVHFEPKPHLHIDALEFRKPFGHAPTLEDLMNKAALYGGPFMPGYESVDALGWVEQTRAGLDRLFCDVMKRLLDELFAAERWNDMVTWAEHWIAHSDLPRDGYSDLLAAYSELGNLPKLDATYKRYAHALGEIGVSPSEALQRQYEFWRKALVDRYSKPSPNGRPTPPTAPSDLSPPKPLPQPPTSFINRANDLAKIDEKLGGAECQLLVLVGIGGVGKTRLALHAAQAASAHFEDGVAFVNLGQVSNPEQLAASLADALSFVPYGQEPLLAQVQTYLSEKHLLIVFDAFEHVIQEWTTVGDGAAADGVQWLDELLDAAPGVKALITSRERLRLQREYALPIEGLDYPDGGIQADDLSDDEIERYGAVKLFLRTARRVRNDFSLQDEKAGVVRICQHTRGLPLALDLAAVQVVGLSAAEIADAIEANLDLLEAHGTETDERHRSVRAAFEYSWQMLTAEEQRAFAQLSAFAGSFGREAALTVTQASQRVLNALVGNTLLRYDYKAARYDLHDLLRQFGAEKLQQVGHGLGDEVGAEDVARRMADYYLSFARRNQKRFDALELEWANFLATLRTAHRAQRWPLVMDFASTLTEAWFTRARFGDARQGLAWAREAARAAQDDAAHLMLNTWYGRALIQQGDYDDAQAALEQSEQMAARLGNLPEVANAQFEQARIAWERSDYRQAQQVLQACRQIRTALNNADGVAETLRLEAWIAYNQNHYADAQQLAEQALAIYETSEHKRPLVQTLRLLTIISTEQRLFDLAQGYCQRALTICAETNDEHESAEVLYASAQLHFRLQNPTAAAEYAQQGLDLFRKVGDRKNQAHVSLLLCYIHEELNEQTQALAFANHGLQLYRSLRDEWCMVYCLLCAGDFLNKLGQPQQARAYWSEGLHLATKLHHPDLDELQKRLA